MGLFCARRACSAFRRYSDLGATENEPDDVMDGLAESGGVEGRGGALRAELRDEGVDMLVGEGRKGWCLVCNKGGYECS